MTVSALDAGLHTMAFARRVFVQLLDAIPADKLLYQPVPGANHALWNAGHLACTDDWIVGAVAGGGRCLEGWERLFGGGSVPVADAAAYPSIGDVTTALAERREALVGWFRSLSPSQQVAAPPEQLAFFAPTLVGMAGPIGWHEGTHAGQLTVIRKSLGLAPLMG